MYLKRKNAEGSVMKGSPDAAFTQVISATQKWNVGQRYLDQGIASGHISLSGGKIVIKTGDDEDDLVYRIINPPRHFCVHCGLTVGSTLEGLGHIEAHHKGEDSPDPENPSGVRRNNYYECEYVSGPMGDGPQVSEVIKDQARKNRAAAAK